MAINLQSAKDKIKEILKDLSTNSGHAMLTYIINEIYIDNYVDWNISNWSVSEITDALKAVNDYLKNNDVSKLMKEINNIISKHSKNSAASQLMSITSMAWTENIQTQDISSATSLSNGMITSNKDAATVIFGLLFEFKYGIGPETREFGESSVITRDIIDWSLVEQGREYFYQTKAPVYADVLKTNDYTLLSKKPMALQKNGGDNIIFNASFTPVELIKAGLDLVRQYLGGFYMEIYPDIQGKEMNFVLYNDVNLKSLVLHYLVFLRKPHNLLIIR